MKKRYLIPLMLSAYLLTACDPGSVIGSSHATSGMSVDSAAADGYSNYSMSKMTANSLESADTDAVDTSDTLAENEAASERKMIRTVSLSFTIPSSDTLAASVNTISSDVAKFGGYVANNDSTYGDYAYGSLSIKIPTAKADAFIEALKGSGMKLTNFADSTEDVTLQYVDVASRLKVKEETKKKYEEYLAAATSMEDTMSIEKELSSVISDIESYQSQLNVLKNQVDYTTISVSISCERSEEAETFPEEFMRTLKNLGSEVGGTFIDGFCWFVNALVMLLFAVPLLIIVIRAVMFAVGRPWKRKKKEKKAEKNGNLDKAAEEAGGEAAEK